MILEFKYPGLDFGTCTGMLDIEGVGMNYSITNLYIENTKFVASVDKKYFAEFSTSMYRKHTFMYNVFFYTNTILYTN